MMQRPADGYPCGTPTGREVSTLSPVPLTVFLEGIQVAEWHGRAAD
jgi:hypothetical protein